MLSLQSASDARWLTQVDTHLDDILIDHAHCEKKAAGVAMNLLFSYVDHVPLARAMTEIVNEELSHFQLVLDLLERRGIRFRKLSPSSYGQRLHACVRKEEPVRATDRLLVAGLIEARSCERFALLRDHLADAAAPGILWQPVRIGGPAPRHVCPPGLRHGPGGDGAGTPTRVGSRGGCDHFPG